MMSFSLSGGVEVLGFISPTDPLDTYPVIDPIYGIDGFRNVDLISDLDLIPNPRRRAGMVVGISGGTQYYKLNPSPWNGDITDWSVFNTELTGNYLPLSGGSVTGNTTITGAFRVTGNTITYGNLTGLGPSSTYIATPLTINPGDYSRFIQSYYFKLHPEGSNSFIPYFINDIGYLTLRGGSVTSNFSGLTQTQIETIFDGTPKYAIFNPSLLGTGMTLNISFGQTFNFTNILVISFGAANWRSQDFTVELSSGGTYSTLDVVTGFTESDYSIKFSLPQGNTFDGCRITFSNFFNTSSPTGFRIADISLLAFNSNGPKSLYVGRDGGDIYKQLYVTGATETRPSYSTLNDIDSGMYFPSANTIGFSTNGSEKVRIDSTGNVGIGTVNPITKLHVSGNTVISNGLTATTISATTYQNLPTDVRVTGGTYSSGTATFTNNTGGTFSVTGFSTGGTFTGGTVSGATNFTNGLTANTISATTFTANTETIIGRVPTGAIGSVSVGSPTSVYVQGRYAYVTNLVSNTLQIFDISNPSSPVSVGSVSTGTSPQKVYVQGRYAYVVNSSSNTLQIFDVSNPSSPVSVGTVSTGSFPYGVYVQGRYVYVVNLFSNTLQIFDISNPPSPILVGTVSSGSNPQKVYVQGRYAYVVNNGSNTLQIFDILNPSSPVSVGTVSTGSFPNNVYVQGIFAYVVNDTSSNTLQIFNVSNPSSPVSVGTVSTGARPQKVYVQGRYAYVVSTSNTLQIFDISNPPSPILVGTVSTGSNPTSVYVQGRYAYVVNYSSNTLQIFDISGSYIQQLEAGGILTNTLESVGNATIGNDLAVVGGLNVSQSTNILGNLSATNMRVVSGLTATTISATTYQNLPTDVNIYNTNGTLTGARSVNLSGNQLTFSSSTTGTNVIGLYGSGNTSTSRTYFEMGQRNNGGFSSSVFFTSFAPNYSDTSWGSFYSGSSMLSAYHENPVTTGGFGNLFFDISQFGSTVANRYFAWHAAPVTTARSLSTEMMRLHILGNGDGNLGINTKGVPTQKLHVSGNTLIEGSLTANTITLVGGDQAPSLNTTVSKTLTGGTNTIYSIPTSAYTGSFFDYTLISSGSTGARAGTIMSIWSGSTAQFLETSTPSIGTTTGVTFSVAVSGGNAVLSSSATTAGWVVKTIVRTI
jgi:hypothetical protein